MRTQKSKQSKKLVKLQKWTEVSRLESFTRQILGMDREMRLKPEHWSLHLPYLTSNKTLFFLKFSLLSIFLVFKPSMFDLILKRKEARLKNLHRGILNIFNTRVNVTHTHVYIHTSLLTCTPQTGELESIHQEKLLDIELVANIQVLSCLFI